ncbi:MAG: saccharopine dehydrogenase NADP-binding domain-containing protein [Candidatus Cloacimonetes bacterium]|nr:saccharopine dehydrogenase NADP-binding domain-containing protein [Candidatus Cloacimonadota bacterium]MCF7813341.1 saccharopine dehydrogenase NADP-binding domain-containing protein [Candidatus Cloacimonadota bacterium]MCF7867830.1 saccharopine dehydrogenase NADP-binding domain-containing protein [Candidatus Cloacimonadota bacterium]MCF7883284.1 saccharopine dehydrogenase NADP-binding domain-containing protein [Candidatus Cloacimonadota bacterium]
MPKKIVIFGAGLVTKPMVDYLANHQYETTVADIVLEKAQVLADPHSNVQAVQLDSQDEKHVERLIQNCDLAVSLLPAAMHPKIAKKCIKLKKHMVTASYISEAMRKLDEAAKSSGITILNEIGVDPGIDHMSAMKIFHEVQEKGGNIVSFMSYCGGLPAPEADTNPLGYKFSWAPKGVLTAAGNGATYLKDDNVIKIPGEELFSHYWLVEVPGAGVFEAYPNRDSLSYIKTYNLKNVKTMYRGTFRKISHCDLWYIFGKMGFFKQEPVYKNLSGTVREFILTKMMKLSKDACLKTAIAEKYNISKSSIILKKMAWLGFFDDTPIPLKKGAGIDVLTALMLDKMQYEKGERDLLVLHHEFIADFAGKEQRITSTMIDHGIPNGDTSMARTVSLPAAIGVHLILAGKIKRTGVIMPKYKEIYQPVLQELDKLGIKIEEKYY